MGHLTCSAHLFDFVADTLNRRFGEPHLVRNIPDGASILCKCFHTREFNIFNFSHRPDRGSATELHFRLKGLRAITMKEARLLEVNLEACTLNHGVVARSS